MKNWPLTKSTCFLALGLVLAGCGNNQLAQKSKTKAPAQTEPSYQLVVDSSRVVVIPNPYVDDPTLASKAADEARQELIKRGVKIVGTEAEADVVAIPTVETSVTTVTSATATKQPDVFVAAAGLTMDRAWALNNSLGSLDSAATQFSIRKGGDQLVIEGFKKDAWDKALIVNELQLQPVWKVRIALPKSLKPSLEGAAVAGTSDTNFEPPR
jgi:ABC-type glycerol-3-phosphate transport system substrate-binding protein